MLKKKNPKDERKIKGFAKDCQTTGRKSKLIKRDHMTEVEPYYLLLR